MYAAPFAYFRKENIIWRQWRKDKENKREKATDNGCKDGAEAKERAKKIERLPLPHLIYIPCQRLRAKTVCPVL